MEWADFVVRDFSFVEFAPGSRVVDVGCGAGEQLEDLRRAGLDPVGVERSQSLVDEIKARGLPAVRGVAEQLPLDSQSVDGVICKVVLPYTDERKAIAEWARVLRPGGRVLAAYHGAGYYLRYLTKGPGLALRVYGARSLVNTWWYASTDRRMPGFLGDTIYQSAKRLAEYYDEFGFALERNVPAPRFGGKPVFIYHELRRVNRPSQRIDRADRAAFPAAGVGPAARPSDLPASDPGRRVG
jgi:SAM-dependent methyltransferase